jgi:hypothetical protein
VCGCILGITGLTQKHFDSIGGGLGILTGLFFGALENPITTGDECKATNSIPSKTDGQEKHKQCQNLCSHGAGFLGS